MKYLIFILLALMISCEHNVQPENNSTDFSILEGSWLVTNSYPTNGPICIFIEKSDTVRFQLIDDNSLIMFYKSENNYFEDFFNFTINNNKLVGIGNYKVKVLNKKGEFIDTLYPQKLYIELGENEIKCSIEHGIIDYNLDSLVFGEVSNFTALKVNL